MDSEMTRTVVVIVTPAWAEGNNGNWQTARRWARHLGAKHTVVLVDRWPTGRAQVFGRRAATTSEDQARRLASAATVLIALHAHRSHSSIQAWHHGHGPKGLAVVLTGTDLYRVLPGQDDIATREVMESLRAAQALVVLQDQAPEDLPAEVRHKASVIFQSTGTRSTLHKPDLQRFALRALMVGHLREEKDPQTLQQAAALLHPRPTPSFAILHTSPRRLPPIRIDHLGAALDPRFASEARATQEAHPHYRWLGGCKHAQTRARIQRAHVLVHTSRMEGGAHVIMEAVCSGTPVLASRMAGNVGMLGVDYAGYFEVGDAAGLAQALRRFQADPGFRATLERQCAARSGLFSPEEEARAVQGLAERLLRAAP